ncbi:response regulator transcription factor [Streptomyces sp. NPDC006739]|uniref:response regulator transcription factor n=1 Tax=Streptomyces sp. NPDC006739 TaxID=3364763 RepID=UPI0036CDC7BB
MDERQATLRVLPSLPSLPSPPAPPFPSAVAAPASDEDPTAPVRVLVVGDDPLARVGIRSLLENHSGIRIAGEAAPDVRFPGALRTLRPHVLVVHGSLTADQRELVDREAGDAVGVLVLGGPVAGAGPSPDAGRWTVTRGQLPTSATPAQVASAVVLTAAGYTLVPGAPHTAPAAPRVSSVHPDRLTDRECEVLELIARGLTNAEIATSLTVSEHTVKSHVQNLLHKLRLRNRVHAAIYAFEAGIRQFG